MVERIEECSIIRHGQSHDNSEVTTEMPSMFREPSLSIIESRSIAIILLMVMLSSSKNLGRQVLES